jgi:avermitilol synthase
MAHRTERAVVSASDPPREPRVNAKSPWEAKKGASQVEGPSDTPVANAYTEGGAAAAPANPRQVHIPDLYCPFDPGVHPQAAHVHSETVAWARAMGLARDEAHVQALHKAKVGWLVARAFPITDRAVALQIAADWITLFCLIDTHIETIHGQALSHVYLKGLLNVFRDGAKPVFVDPFSNAFRDLRERIIEVDVPQWISRFSEQLERLFAAYVDEAKYRQLEEAPELVKYRKMREVSSGLYFGFRLGELTDNITLPPHVRDHHVVRSLESKASMIVGLANDIYTVEKELAKGEVNNMVLVLMHEEQLDLDTAMARAVELHDTETREFVDLSTHLPKFSPEVDVELQRYVEVLSSMISGHRSWAIETDRYVPRRDGQSG